MNIDNLRQCNIDNEWTSIIREWTSTCHWCVVVWTSTILNIDIYKWTSTFCKRTSTCRCSNVCLSDIVDVQRFKPWDDMITNFLALIWFLDQMYIYCHGVKTLHCKINRIFNFCWIFFEFFSNFFEFFEFFVTLQMVCWGKLFTCVNHHFTFKKRTWHTWKHVLWFLLAKILIHSFVIVLSCIENHVCSSLVALGFKLLLVIMWWKKQISYINTP